MCSLRGNLHHQRGGIEHGIAVDALALQLHAATEVDLVVALVHAGTRRGSHQGGFDATETAELRGTYIQFFAFAVMDDPLRFQNHTAVAAFAMTGQADRVQHVSR